MSRRWLAEEQIWSCRIRRPDSHSLHPFANPQRPFTMPSIDSELRMSSSEDAHAQGKSIQEAMSMATKLQNGIEDDLEIRQDPDAQATVTDFLDFTEYLPSDMTRSLTLIGNLDQKYIKASKNVHELTRLYGDLPSRPPSDRPRPGELRSDVSQNLTEAVKARTLSYEEACRLKENVDRHFNRLKNIYAKLKKMAETYPASRAASPEQQQSNTPQATRTAPKVTLRLDGQKAGKKAGDRVRKHRTPRITVPGEVMAPFEVDYDSYGSLTDMELSDDERGLSRTQTPGAAPNKPRSIKLNIGPKPLKEKVPKASRMRADGSIGTNVHSMVAGISTSNALAKLKPPAPDAKPGDPDAPWLKLTAWELAKLRKKMKKNAVWNPSDTMIARELQSKGRAIEDYNRHNEGLKAAGLPALDIFPQMMNAASAMRVLEEGEISAEAWKKGELSNRGMKLNEAKKLKKENEKKAAEDPTNTLNEPSTTRNSEAVKEIVAVKDVPVNNTQDAPTKDIAAEDVPARDSPAKDTPAKSSAKITLSKPKPSKKAVAKELKEVKNGSKDDSSPENPTETQKTISAVEGVMERVKALKNSLPVSTNEKNGENSSATPKKQPAKTNRKRKTRDSTADTETSKASKASKVEGPVAGSSLRVERRSEAETPIPTPPHLSSGTSSTTSVPLAPPGTTSTRSNIRRGTPAPVAMMGVEPTVFPDEISTKLETVPSPPEPNGTAEPVNQPEPAIQSESAQESAGGPSQEQETKAEKEVIKQPLKKKETQKQKRAREKKEREAKMPAAPPARNHRKASIAPATPAPEIQALPPRRIASRPSSRGGKAASHEPQPLTIKDRPRRSSTAHNTPVPEPRGPSKRLEAKRPPPGQVTAGPEGSASVSVSKRKAAPKKRAAAASSKKQKSEEGKELVLEDMVEFDDDGNIIDASEPRYCKCNKVSYGDMIACDSDKILGRDCPFGEWFHYECMGFSETNMPPRRDSWFCEGCTKEINAHKVQTEKGGNKRK